MMRAAGLVKLSEHDDKGIIPSLSNHALDTSSEWLYVLPDEIYCTMEHTYKLPKSYLPRQDYDLPGRDS